MPAKIGLEEFEPLSEALRPVVEIMRSMGLERLDIKLGVDHLSGLKSEKVRADVQHRDGSVHSHTLWRYPSPEA